MGRPGITREQVFEAASAIVHEGITPTVMAVRKPLGGGSPNNITKWLGEWKAQNESTRVEALPPLPEPVQAAMRQVWGSACKGARDRLESEREALSAAHKEIERERAQMLAEIARLDGELEAARAQLQEKDKSLDEQRRSHEETRAQLREARVLVQERSGRIDEQAAELKEVRGQSSDAQAQAKRLEAEVKRAGESAKQAKTALDLGGKKIPKLEAVLEEERQARASAEREAAELRAQVATLTERTARMDELQAMIERLK
jgi:chromosome segregation ATPase